MLARMTSRLLPITAIPPGALPITAIPPGALPALAGTFGALPALAGTFGARPALAGTFGAVLALAGCAAPAPPAPVAATHQVAVPHHAAPPADWFHRQLALARHARAVHLPVGDRTGAQRAYFAVMVPACGRIASSGPDKYRPRCKALISQATTDSVDANTAPANAAPLCDQDRDDSGQTPSQITACSD
jgi:hypothetical protein